MHTLTKKQKKTIAEQISLALDTMFTRKGGKKKLAAMIGVTPAAISHWKKGDKTPTLHHLVQLSIAFGVPVHVLYGFSGKRKIHAEDLVFELVMNLSIFGERIEKAGKMTPTMRRALKKANEALDRLLEKQEAYDLN